MRTPRQKPNSFVKLLKAIQESETQAEKPATFEEFLRRRGHSTEDDKRGESA